MLVVGLTGGIGAGKSTVAALLARHGAAVVDVDALGREIVAAGGPATEAVVARFGEGVRAADGGVDRPALAAIVFDDPAALADLNAVSHPVLDRLIDERLDEIAAAGRVAVLDMAVLAESTLGRGNRRPYEVVVVVEAPADVRLARLVERGMTAADATARMGAQATDEQRRALADFVLGNGGTPADLEPTVARMWEQLRALALGREGA
ncbi:MAG TPA: dephospho-CoA kinase [Acidimicrobiaceae bacterium]|nr:dephospho-CoA kinase [Acidimicrobiaceae bacterium]HCB36636.1 dephospho-CoA kinase [Acidimicrobiaceae bacterium]